jgi:TolA-binding protein
VIASPGAAVEEPDAPEAIVERIRSLRRAGRDDQARALLRELVARHPGFILPEDLRQSF